MVAEGVALAVFLAYFHLFRSSSDGAGALGASLLLRYFRNCEIKNNGLTYCFWSLRAIFTKLLLVCTYTQLMTHFRFDGIE